jgi:hypothetical protein
MSNTRENKNLTKYMFYFLTFLIFYLTISTTGFAGEVNKNELLGKTAKARYAVEHAWETYHDAALGGTLASPAIQTKLEMNLHKSRALLAEAYDAEDSGDIKKLNKMIIEIMKIKNEVVTESREQKKR